ncbi:MAG: AAA family ATPase [Bacteroidales bacterium]|jgi:predicted AAA+ superfamily ATPase|nr:AAA family ATPase [Bacteroidales bacterium]
MIQRNALKYLENWAKEEDRKPLVLRGARQTGKTTLVNEFAKQFNVYFSLNLDKQEDRELFELNTNVNDLLTSIYRYFKQVKTDSKTLLFIDEIQNSPKAVSFLRYFYEEVKSIYVIAAGSLLESLIDKNISFPVGRVEFLAIRPCSFYEFMDGIGEKFDLELIHNLEVTDVHKRIMQYFYDYAIVGGMPAVIQKYLPNRDVLAADKIYELLLNSYVDDVEKYARNQTMSQVIRFIIKSGWAYASERITFERFANSNYRSREVGEAFRTLEKALLLEMIYPITETRIPMLHSTSRKPKLIWLDTGLVNYIAGVRDLLFSVDDITDAWRGRIAEHIVAQELLAYRWEFSAKRCFWERSKPQSSAEVDFVIQYKNLVIPIEVKSGHNSKLKSLHLFMEKANHNIAVRVWSNPFSIDDVSTNSDKIFKLINIPFYYIGQLNNIINKYI